MDVLWVDVVADLRVAFVVDWVFLVGGWWVMGRTDIGRVVILLGRILVHRIIRG